MITSRNTEGENRIFKSPLWRSVCVSVGPILNLEFLIHLQRQSVFPIICLKNVQILLILNG